MVTISDRKWRSNNFGSGVMSGQNEKKRIVLLTEITINRSMYR